MARRFNNIGMIGAGCYGTALAQCFAHSMPNKLLLVSDIPAIANEINEEHTHEKALPGVRLDHKISATSNIGELADCDIIFIAVPVEALPIVCDDIFRHKFPQPLVLCSKGLDPNSGNLLSNMFGQYLKNQIVILSGASFAREIAQGLPACVNVASSDYKLACDIAQELSAGCLHIKALKDPIGMQISGAFKNVLAIGCGVLIGAKCGASTIAYFIVQGLKEMISLSKAFGGTEEVFWESCGIGDILLTCTGSQSRNISFGKHLVIGGRRSNWYGELVEGIATAKWVKPLEEKFGLQLPLFHSIYRVVHEDASIQDIVNIVQ